MKTIKLKNVEARPDPMDDWYLVDDKTLKQVRIGERRTTSKGEKVILVHRAPPHKPQSSGKVVVESVREHFTMELYPSVIGCHYQRRKS